MWLEVNPRLAVPIYQQVVDGVKAAIAKGTLKSGDKIPSIRELAVELMLNHNTVAKAYQILEREHVIEVLRGRGTFVAVHPSVPNRTEREAQMREMMQKLLIEAHHLQLTEDDLVTMFQAVLRDWHHQETGSAKGGVASEAGGTDD